MIKLWTLASTYCGRSSALDYKIEEETKRSSNGQNKNSSSEIWKRERSLKKLKKKTIEREWTKEPAIIIFVKKVRELFVVSRKRVKRIIFCHHFLAIHVCHNFWRFECLFIWSLFFRQSKKRSILKKYFLFD